VRVWSTFPASAASRALEAEFGIAITPIRPFAGQLPRGGRLLLWGTHFVPGVWLGAAAPRAVAIVSELFHAAALYRSVLAARAAGLPEPVILHVSRLLHRAVVLDGAVLYPPSNLAPMFASRRPRHAGVVIGRVSRDIPDKHHDDDPALYAALAARGLRVRILGGTCLAARVGALPGIELLPEGSIPPAQFLASLDIFFYRTAGDRRYVEPSGLAVAEAMAAGLALVVCPPGGFTDLIEHGVNGWIVDAPARALQDLLDLAADAVRRERMGAAARAHVADYFGPGYAARLKTALFGAAA
jgi:glycosyltransferase involved in cell wall biosynthesis